MNEHFILIIEYTRGSLVFRPKTVKVNYVRVKFGKYLRQKMRNNYNERRHQGQTDDIRMTWGWGGFPTSNIFVL